MPKPSHWSLLIKVIEMPPAPNPLSNPIANVANPPKQQYLTTSVEEMEKRKIYFARLLQKLIIFLTLFWTINLYLNFFLSCLTCFYNLTFLWLSRASLAVVFLWKKLEIWHLCNSTLICAAQLWMWYIQNW